MKSLYLAISIAIGWSSYCSGQSSTITQQENRERNDNVVYTILCDNTTQSDSVFADHGFSCLIESEDHTCLYDAGNNSDKFMANVGTLGIDCSGIDQVFISHIHGDHMGGLFDILEKCNKPKFCLPVSYPRPEGESFGDQADADFRAMLEQLRPFISEIVQDSGLAALGGDFYTTGVIEYQSYEQALILPTSRGLAVFTGCAHPGIVQIVKYARERMEQNVHFVMGGFHLMHTDSSQVKTIAQELRRLTKYIGPCHCTGEEARAIFKEVFGEDYVDVYAGLRLQMGEGKLR